MRTAVIYARYSSDRQTEQSIEGQLTVCNRYAEQNDITIVGQYIDRAMTGTNDNRAGFQRMLKDCTKRAWDVILVYKLDRFSRNKYETAIHKKTLRDNGIKLISATEHIPDSPEGIILESMLEGMAEYYSAELSQKVKRGQAEGRRKGNFMGGLITYGYKAVGTKLEGRKLAIQEDEAEVVRYVFENFTIGRTMKEIQQDLLDKGVLCKGRPFAKSTLYRLIGNEKYAGIYNYNGETFTNIYPAIIPQEMFNVAKMKLDSNKYGGHNVKVVYLLKNKLKCGYCEHTINSETGTARNGEVFRYYKCTGRREGLCEQMPIRKEVLEKLVVDATLAAFESSKVIEDLAEKILAENAKRDVATSIINLLTSQLNDIQRSITNIMKAIEQGVVTSTTKQRLEELENQKVEIEVKLHQEKAKATSKIQKADIARFLSVAIQNEPLPMITLLIKKVVLFNDRIEIYYNYTDTPRPDDDHRAFSFYKTTHSIFRSNCAERIVTYTIEAFI